MAARIATLPRQQRLDRCHDGAPPSNAGPGAPLWHGVSLSPNGAEVYVLDKTAQTVQVWTADDAPIWLATIPLRTSIKGAYTNCAYSCTRVGWPRHSYDGRYVFVGDSGDVIDTQMRQITTNIAAMRNTRHNFLKIDWAGGVPTATTTHFSMGRQ